MSYKRRIIIKLPIQCLRGSNEIINGNAKGTALDTQLRLNKHWLGRQPGLSWHRMRLQMSEMNLQLGVSPKFKSTWKGFT